MSPPPSNLHIRRRPKPILIKLRELNTILSNLKLKSFQIKKLDIIL